jgi:Ca2+-binding RTX toxin-like protein
MNSHHAVDLAELALAAYGQFESEGIPATPDLVTLNHDVHGFSTPQANRFRQNYEVALRTFSDQESLGGSGTTSFDVTVFKVANAASNGQLVLAFRGTQQLDPPVSSSDVSAINDLINKKAAARQIVAMYNWWQRGSTVNGREVPQFGIATYLEGQARSIGAKRLSSLSEHEESIVLPAGQYLIRIADAESNGTLLRATGDNAEAKVVVTGSSLGGHLAMAFAGLFGSRVEQSVAFNSPGFPDNEFVDTLFHALGGSVPKAGDPLILNFISSETQGVESEFSLIAGYPDDSFPGVALTVPVENQLLGDVPDPKRPSFNHDQRQVTDSLTVFDLFHRLDNSLTLSQFGRLLRASANGQNRSLENLVDGVEVLLGIDRSAMEAGNAFRNDLHLAVQRIVGGSPAFPVAHPQFAALAGHVFVKVVTQDLVALAATEFGMLVALRDLSPFYLTSASTNAASEAALTAFWQQSHAVDFADWTSEKSAVNPAVFSTSWLQERAKMLDAMAYRNERDLVADTPLLGARNTDMVDMASHQSVVLRRGGPIFDADVQRVTFGDDNDNAMVGDAWDDRLYGDFGNDRLEGLTGNDYLEGGRGSDTYVFAADFGVDTIHDLDGLGSIELDGRTLRGGRSSGFANVWWGDGVDGATEHYAVRASKQSVTGKQLVITRAGDSVNTITVNNFDLQAATAAPEGFLGMHLEDSQQCVIVQGAGDGIDTGAQPAGFWDTVVGTVAGASEIGEGGAEMFTVFLRSAARSGEAISLALSHLAEGFDMVMNGAVTRVTDTRIALEEGQTRVSFGLLQHGNVDADIDVQLHANVTRDGASIVSNAWTLHLQDSGVATQTTMGDQTYGTRVSSYDMVRDGRVVVAAGGLAYLVDSDDNLVIGGDLLLSENVLYGSSGSDRIDALSGNDAIDGGDGNDLLDGGDGDDLIAGGAGDNHLVGGSGNDFLAGSAVLSRQLQQLGPNDRWQAPMGKIVLGHGATWGVYLDTPDLLIWDGVVNQGAVVGTNLIEAGAGNDFIVAGPGDDRVDGGDGDDRIDGMAGGDFIDAGSGDDVIWGDGIVTAGYLNSTPVALHGADQIYGGVGDDEIHGGGGSDLLFGADGADFIYGDSAGRTDGALFVDLSVHGADTIDGGGGDDYLEGNGGDDTIFGGAGADTIWGDTTASNIVGNTSGSTAEALAILAYGDDILEGDGGNDRIVGGGGDDHVYGGDDNDSLWGDQSTLALAGRFHGADYLDGGRGDDILVGGGADDTLLGGDGADQLTGDDTPGMLAGAFHGADYLDGGDGHDVLIGGGGADVLFGGAGDDRLSGDALAPDAVSAAFDGDDQLHGEDGDDQLLGGGGFDTLYGGAGADQLDGGAGADRMLGGSGDDIYVVDDVADVVLEFAGEGFDTVLSSVDITLPDHVENLFITGSGAVAVTGNQRDNTITGNDAANHIVAGAGDDQVDGGDGADLLEGGAGDDSYAVDDLADQVIENLDDGYDRVRVSVSYALSDNVEQLTAIGDADLLLTGNAGDNTIFGNAGNNQLDGGDGDDYLSGGAGDDIYLFGRGGGHDVIRNTDFLRDTADLAAVAAVDTLWFGPGILASDVVGWRFGDDMLLSIKGTGDQVTIAGHFEAEQIDGNRISDHGIDRVAFADGSDWGPTALQVVVDKAAHNRAPLLVTPLPALHGRALDAFTHVLADTRFVDPDAGDVIRYSASLADGTPLPDWLAFDALTHRLSGRPVLADVGTLNLAIWATDSYGAATGAVVPLTVHPLNRAPLLSAPVPDQVAPYRGQFDYQVATGTFSDPDWGDSLVLDATLADGSPMPDWLTYRAVDRRFLGISDTPQVLEVQLAATDTGYLVASDTFTIVVGGPVVQGTPGNDSLVTPAAGGTLHGLAGNDDLTGGAGNDVLVGGDGDDTLVGRQGSNFLDGGSGADVLTAGEDVFGSSGNTLLGGDGNDTLLAKLHSLDNTLEGGAGDDAITGSGYGDIYRFSLGDGRDTITERETTLGFRGNDVFMFGPDVVPDDVHVARSLVAGSTDDLLLSVGEGADQVTVKGWFASTPGFSDTERRIEVIRFADDTEWHSAAITAAALQVQGSALDDTLTGSDGDDILRGLGGNDTLRAGRGHNTLDGGDGDDDLYADDGQYRVTTFYGSGAYQQTFWASNLLLGGTGDDLLHASTIAHGTVFAGGPGNDTLQGSWYNDTYRFNIGDGCDTITEATSVAGFDDTLVFGPEINASDVGLYRSGNDLLFSMGNTADTLAVLNWFAGQDHQIESVAFAGGIHWNLAGIDALLSTDRVGTNNVDKLTGTTADDKMMGLSGADVINGLDGNDRLFGGQGNDTVSGDQGRDHLYGGRGNDALYGGSGADTLTGDAVFESSAAQPVESLVVFARGTVCLDVWPKMAVWIGGVRVQTFDVDSTGFAAYVVDVPPGMVATEVAVAFSNDAYRPDLGQDRNLYVDRIEVNGEALAARGAGAVTDFGSGASAFDGVNTMSSWGGLSSHGAIRFSLLGSDLLDGGLGADTMTGGVGNDIYQVDDIADTIVEKAGGGHDVVRASVSHGLSEHVEDLELTGAAAIDATGNSGRNTLRGNAAANRLDGGSGADVMVGGQGDDIYMVDDTADVTYERSGGGTDTVVSNVSHTLRAEVENLTLTGSGSIQGNGNDHDNVLVGNGAGNTLSGGAGTDTLRGEHGNDNLYGGSGDDILIGDADGESSAVHLVDSLVVFARGTICLDVWPKMAVWIGGVRVQTFDVDSTDFAAYVVDVPPGMVSTEVAVAFTNDAYRPDLGQDRNLYVDRIEVNGEAISARGAGAVTDFGSGASAFDGVNTMSSWGGLNSHGAIRFSLLGSDLLDGGFGADAMTGGVGNDIYQVDDIADTIVELAGGGHDIVRASVSHVLSDHVEDLELTGSAAIDATGNDGRNTLRGNTAANRLDGGSGADVMVGGQGDDIYMVDDMADLVYERVGGGIDTVVSSISHSLRAEVENLTLTGGSSIQGNGNDHDNVLVGNGAGNTLSGGAGNDTLHGERGNDNLYGGSGDDTLIGDTVGEAGAAQSVDTLVVFARGTVCLDVWPKMGVWVGGVRVQTFDVDSTDFAAYVVDVPPGMVATEVAVAFTNDAYRPDLGQDRNLYVDRIEVNGQVHGAREAGVVLDFGSGEGAFDGFNTASSWGGLSSNSALHFGLLGADRLDGGMGADVMDGGMGNDSYLVDNSQDAVIEVKQGGHDIVRSSATFTLSGNIEDLELIGSAAIDGTGNTMQNTLRGNSAANRLDGGGGTDLLVGGAGGDSYVLSPGNGHDSIYEYDLTAGVTDTAQFAGDVVADQLWFSRTGSSLQVGVIGTGDQLRISGWYAGAQHRIERFMTSDGETLLDSQVQNLVDAMAAFAPPPMGQTSLSDGYADALTATIAANWH